MKKSALWSIIAASSIATTIGLSSVAQAGTLEDVKARDELRCGVTQGLPGFSSPDDEGNWTGLDVDYCRAIAAAVLGDASKVSFRPTSSKERFTVLQSGELDILSRVTTWTLSRDTELGMNFAGVMYYDGQGFMVTKDLGVTSAKELDGASICMNTGTSTEVNIGDYFRKLGIEYTPVTFEKSDEALAAYISGRCDVYTSDLSGLASQRLKLADPSAHMLLPEVISKEPLGPLVRHGDDQWFDIAKWTLNAMIQADESGITSANVDDALNAKDPVVKRLLGTEGNNGEKLGLNNDWAYQIIKQVGSYGESFDKNLTQQLGIERGLNANWRNGGLMYAIPLR